MRSERFFKNRHMPFAEVRYSKSSTAPFKQHIHRTLSIGAVEQGRVLYNVSGTQVFLEPGSIAVINPEILHACNPATDAGRSYYMLYLDAEWCFRVQQSMWNVDSFVLMEKVSIEDASLYAQFCNTMELLMDEDIHLQQKEQILFDLVSGVFLVACSPQSIMPEQRENIDRLKELLSADLSKDLPINTLAKELEVNPYTLIRSFKAITGITPHAYRMNCRIEQAKLLLRQGTDIAETALQCGFFDQSHFHRHFKAMTTVTPQEYRVNFVQ